MDLSQVAGSIPLPACEPLRLSNGYGRRISVVEGDVWVTQDGDPRDIVLHAGDSFRFDRPSGAIVSALGANARIVREDGVGVNPPEPGGDGRGLLQRAVNAWSQWQRTRRLRRARASLHAMSDYLLADIGLRREGCATLRID